MNNTTILLKSSTTGVKAMVEFFIRNECAIQITHEQDSVTIAFYKGVWEVQGTQTNHHFSIDDAGSLLSGSPLTQAFVKQRFTTWLSRISHDRQAVAMAIIDAIGIHYGEKMFGFMSTVIVHQLGRNSYLNDGKLSLSPRKEDVILYRAKYDV